MSDDLRGLFRSTDPEAIDLWDAICNRHEDARRRAVTFLRDVVGVKLIHPDDGWVTRRADGTGSFSLSWYAHLDLRPEVGDLMAFGSPPTLGRGLILNTQEEPSVHGQSEAGSVSAYEGYRIVRCTAVERRWNRYGGYEIQRFEYEPVGYWPELPPRSPWWRRLTRRSPYREDGAYCSPERRAEGWRCPAPCADGCNADREEQGR